MLAWCRPDGVRAPAAQDIGNLGQGTPNLVFPRACLRYGARMARTAEITRTTSETDITVRLDLDGSGRGEIATGVGFLDHMLTAFERDKIGEMDTELFEEFFRALAMNALMTLHVTQQAGRNAHHVAEACFKAVARALRMATEADPRAAGAIPSTKGAL